MRPPGYVVVTTAMPDAGTSAAGWVKAMLWAVQLGDLASLSFHLLDAATGRAVVWGPVELADRYLAPVVPVVPVVRGSV